MIAIKKDFSPRPKKFLIPELVLLILLTSFFCLFETACTSSTKTHQTTININTDTVIKPVNRDLFGVSLAKISRSQWLKPVDLKSVELKNLFNDLKPTVITLDNNQLGLPFFPDSTGPFNKRLSIIGHLERINVTRDQTGIKLMEKAKQEKIYSHPPHTNYDDLLGFFESLQNRPKIVLRIPTIFTDQSKRFFNMKVNIDPATGADLVSYLNDDKTTKLGRLRAANGHPDPYNIKTFVLGNEYWTYNQFTAMSREQITSQYSAFARAMKKADPDIKLGINLVDDSYPHEFLKQQTMKNYDKLFDYNHAILNNTTSMIDFVTFHVYSGFCQETPFKNPTRDQWKFVMAQNYFKEKYDCAGKHTRLASRNNKKLDYAVDEYMGPLFSLGGALYNAEYIMYLMNNKPDYATVWNCGVMEPDWYFGLLRVKQGQDANKYVKRPAYYALWVFTNLFSGSIVKSQISFCPTFETKQIESKYFNWPAAKEIPCLKTIASVDNKKLTLIVVNRDMERDITAKINLAAFGSAQNAKVYELNAPSIDANNEKKTDVNIKTYELKGNMDSFEMKFKKHSLTALVFTRK